MIGGFREVSLTTTIGRYQILEKVGQGGMGVVYRAQDTLLERVVALKVIAASIDDNPELRERFFREARAAGQLSHRNIITIHDLGEHEGRPYLAMEFLLGEDLQRRLGRPDPVSLSRKLEVAAEICEGLAFAHRRGVIHRDIKPANIFITDEGVVKILDFGLARMVASEVTASNMMLGTLNYMSPEQVRGERSDHRADIFSFGVVLYELISGRKAFQGDSYATTLYKILQDVPEPLLNLDPALPPDLVKIVDRALAKAREERYQDLTDVARDLALVRQHLSPSYVSPVTLTGSAAASAATGTFQLGPATDGASETTRLQTPPPRLPSSRRRPLVLVAASAVVATAALAAWLAFGRRGDDASDAAAIRTPPAIAVAPPQSSAAAPPARPADPTVEPPAAVRTTPAEPREPDGAAPAPIPPATPRKTVDDARREMTRAKAAAMRAGAAARGTRVFAEALSAEREGARLLRGGQLPEAAAKFYQASGLFHSAELTPQPGLPAATATAPRPAPAADPTSAPADSRPPSAPTPTPEPAAPPAGPAAQPSTAPVDPAPAVAPPLPLPPATRPERDPERLAPAPPAPPAETEAAAEEGVRDAVRRYEQALESRSIDAMRRVWPSLGGAQEEALRKEFTHARRIDVDVDNLAVTVAGATATATFVRRYQLSTQDGQRLMTNTRTTIGLRRSSAEWLIDRVRYEAAR